MRTDTQKMHHSYRNASRQNWGQELAVGEKFIPTDMQVIIGCMMRIADSVEDIATKVDEITAGSEKLRKQNKNLKAYNKRLKKELDEFRGK